MLNQIRELLGTTPNLKAKEIAKKLGIDRREVNSVLYANINFFQKDEEHKWALLNEDYVEVAINSSPWVTPESFEQDLKEAGCLLSSSINSIKFIFPKKCQILLIAGARLISLVNQLSSRKRLVELDFTQCENTRRYLSRLGFFDHLHPEIEIYPSTREESSRAKIYQGKSDNLLEIASIDPFSMNESIPKNLTRKFVKHSGSEYYTAVFTMFSELIGNIYDHSSSDTDGFAALQKYNGSRPHIQTVVSDSGLGIATTIKENLAKFYPELHQKHDMNDIETDIFLVARALTKGRLSRHGPDSEEARGLGLKRTEDFATKYDAETRVRQESFELLIKENADGKRTVKVRRGLTRILGTHICFDFFLD